MWRRLIRFKSKNVKNAYEATNTTNTTNRTNTKGWEFSDTIGPPDPTSLLRPLRLATPPGESALEAKLRRRRLEVHNWNNEFWKDHNYNFHRERGEFITAKLKKEPGKTSLGADEMSIFYKSFLDRNRQSHKKYNFEWYEKNLELLLLSFEVFVERTLKKVKKYTR